MRALKRSASVIILSCMMIMSIFVQTAYAGDDYPGEYRGKQVIDKWKFYTSNCTSFAAWCLNTRNKVGFHNHLGGRLWGHAKSWGHTARALGYVVDKNPAVGSIAWWENGDHGHVAWVSAVNGDNVTIEEYNFRYPLRYGERTINRYNPVGYIHIQDIKAPEPEKPKRIEGNYYSDSSLENGEYIIESVIRDDIVVTVDGKDKDGANIFVMKNKGWDNQIWKLTRLSDGTFQLLSKGHNRVVDVAGQEIGNLINIHVWTWNEQDNQRWYIMKNSDNTYTFIAKHSGYALDIDGGVLKEGPTYYGNIGQYTPNGTNAQKFRLKNIGNSQPKIENPQYIVTFKDYDGQTISSQTIEKNSSASTPDNPYREGYQFAGWDRDYSNITSNLTVFAKYIKQEDKQEDKKNDFGRSNGRNTNKNNLQKWDDDEYEEENEATKGESGKLDFNLQSYSNLKYSARVTAEQMENALENLERDADGSESGNDSLNIDLSNLSADFNSLTLSMTKEVFEYMVDGELNSLQITLPKNKLAIDGAALEEIYDSAGRKKIIIVIKKTIPKIISKKAKNSEEYKNLYTLDIKLGQKNIKKLSEGEIYTDNPFYKLSKKELRKHLIWFKQENSK